MPIVVCSACGAKNRVDERAVTHQPVCGKCGVRLPASVTGSVLTVTDGMFGSAVLQATRPVLLDCWAPWCGPCRAIAPIIEQIARESGGQYIVGKLNTDENPRVASQFRIDAIPTLLIFNGGQLVDRIVGMAPKGEIQSRMGRLAGAGA